MKQLTKAAKLRYVSRLPRKLPEGEVLVHNSARPQRPLGRNGFRAWTQRPGDLPPIVLCDCDWREAAACGHAAHYRVERAPRWKPATGCGTALPPKKDKSDKQEAGE